MRTWFGGFQFAVRVYPNVGFHLTRPDEIHVVCPKCGGRAMARTPARRHYAFHMVDLDPRGFASHWSVTCLECPHRARNLAYRDIGNRYYRVEVRGKELWAWNKDHLVMMLRFLEGQSISDHPYRLYRTFMRKEWISRSNRTVFAKAIRKFLNDEPKGPNRSRRMSAKTMPPRFKVEPHEDGGWVTWPAQKRKRSLR